MTSCGQTVGKGRSGLRKRSGETKKAKKRRKKWLVEKCRDLRETELVSQRKCVGVECKR